MEAVKYWFQIAISALLTSLCLSGFANNNPAAQELQTLLRDLDGIIADFSQQVTNGQGYMVEETQGTLYLAKPRFRWEVLAPYPQVILANGDYIEVYDPDLEQVTQKDIAGAVDQAPLALLTQSELTLADHFVVESLALENAKRRFILSPTSQEALFERLEMVFNGADLDSLQIFDHSGQQTYIRFSNYQSAQSSLFELEYPSGTDFVRG